MTIKKLIEKYIKDGRFEKLPAATLVEVSHHLTEENLDDSQNFSPTVREFVEIAKKNPKTLYSGFYYEEDGQEYIIIDTIYVPKKDSAKILKTITAIGAGSPDESDIEGEYLRLWWD